MSIADLPFSEEVLGSAQLDLTRGYAHGCGQSGKRWKPSILGDFSVETGWLSRHRGTPQT